MVALTVSLGQWQTRRAQEKQDRQQLLEARLREPALVLAGPVAEAEPLLFRRVRVRGTYEPQGQVYIDNRIVGGRAGFQVVTPLAIAGSRAAVLVNRGWTARTADYPALPPAPPPPGEQVVEGLATLPPARVLELSADTVAGRLWQNLSIARYRERTGREVLPFVLLASPAGEGLVAVAETPDAGIAKHREYALTWYSLAATAVALWIGLNLRRAGRG
jgi:surfeit locus 1 family protein